MDTTFKDKKGRVWDVELDLLKAKQIDASDFSAIVDFKFSILNPERELFSNLITRPSFLMAVIWAMVQDQVAAKHAEHLHCKEVGIKPPVDSFPTSPKEDPAGAELEFISGINGSALKEARRAITEAIGDFFPEQRTALSLILRQQEAVIQKIQQKEKKLEAVLEMELEAVLEENIHEMQAKLQATREERHGVIYTPSQDTVESSPPNSSDLALPSGSL